MILDNPRSTRPKKAAIRKTITSTTEVEAMTSLRLGQLTLVSSTRTSRRNCLALSTAATTRFFTSLRCCALGFFTGSFRGLVPGVAGLAPLSSPPRSSPTAVGSETPAFAFLGLLISTKKEMAGQEGFEPPTPGFGVRCSSRSSYWPATTVIQINNRPSNRNPDFLAAGMTTPLPRPPQLAGRSGELPNPPWSTSSLGAGCGVHRIGNTCGTPACPESFSYFLSCCSCAVYTRRKQGSQ
jgi:hypothetical protein